MRWRKLINWPHEELWRGTVFRLLKVEGQHEAPLDLLLLNSDTSPSGFGLVITTGYKAGHMPWPLPVSARAKGNVQAISRAWMIKNWSKINHLSCPIEDVRVIQNYPPAIVLASPGIGKT